MINFRLDLFFFSTWLLRELKGVSASLKRVDRSAYGPWQRFAGLDIVSCQIPNSYQLLDIQCT